MDASSDLAEPREPAPTGGPGKLYALAVVSLALFLVGLIAWQDPIRGFAARATVQYERPIVPGLEDRAATATDEIAAAILSEGTLRKLATELELAASDDESLRKVTPALREMLAIETIPGKTPGTSQIAIRYTGGSIDEGLKIVDALARDFVQLHHGSLDDSNERRAMEQAEKTVAAAAREAERAREQLDAFLKEHLVELQAPNRGGPAQPPVTVPQRNSVLVPRQPTPAPQPESPTVAPVQPPVAEQAPAATVVPEQPAAAPPASPPADASQPHFAAPTATATPGLTPRQALMQRIELLQQKQAEVAAQKTWADPEVRAIADELQLLEKQLRAAPFDPLAPQTPVPQPAAEPATSRAPRDHNAPRERPGRLSLLREHIPLAPATTAPILAKAEEAKAARKQKLLLELEGLQKHQEQMQKVWTQAVAQQQKAAAALPSAPRIAASIVEPAQALGQIGGGVRPGVVVWWGMASLLIGVLIASFAGEPEDLSPLADADDVAARLELPIVGCLAIGGNAPRSDPQPPTPGWTWSCVHIAELALVGMALFLTVRLMGDSPLAARLLGDPLGTFADAWRAGG